MRGLLPSTASSIRRRITRMMCFDRSCCRYNYRPPTHTILKSRFWISHLTDCTQPALAAVDLFG